jgi:hypothetical protein
MEALEVLETGPSHEQNPARRRLTVVVAVLAVVVAGGLWWSDHSRRGSERAALAGCVTRAEQSGRYAEAKVTMMRTYITPVLGSDASESTRSGLFALVREQASQGLPGLEKAQETCRAVGLRSWHGDLTAARRDYLTYLDARTAVLRTISVDGGRSLTGDEGVPALRAKAFAALETAGITP